MIVKLKMPETASTEAFGRRLFVNLVQDRAKHGHNIPFARIARSPDPAQGFRDLSYHELNKSADACARIIEDEVGNVEDFTTFAWLGPVSDLRYFSIVLGAMKTRKKVFLPSPRNSTEAFLSLLDQCKCDYFLIPEGGAPAILEKILQQRPMKVVTVPSLWELIESNVASFDFSETFEDCWMDPVCVLHTSGSTGIPRAITIKHHYWTVVDALNKLPGMGLERYPLTNLEHSNNFIPSPLFHCGGLICGSAFAAYFDQTLISTPEMPLTADAVNQVLKHVAPSYAMLPASVIKDLIDEPSFHENVKKVRYYTTVGAPLAADTGAQLFKLAGFLNTFGMTEASALATETVSAEDYRYHRFSPALGADFHEVGNGQYELIMVKKPEYELFQAIFSTFPELDVFHTKDLFTPHPVKEGLWRYEGRLDDIIVFSNGEKLNPSSIEGAITSHPLIMGALVVGQNQFQAGLLVEPKETAEPAKRGEMLSSLWPVIQEVNKTTIAHGRISRDLVMFTKPDKPFLRAPKGTVQRRATIQLYQEEIDTLFSSNSLALHPVPSESYQRDITSPATILHLLTNLFSDEMGVPSTSLNPSTDLFSIGLDSLQAATISRQLNRHLSRPILSTRNIYNNPSIQQLTDFVTGVPHAVSENRVDKMQRYFNKLVEGLPMNLRPSLKTSSNVVLLIGSTGSLGPYLLHCLLRLNGIQKIYCLNRKPDAFMLQRLQHGERGLTTDFQNVHFMHIVMGQDLFGLDIDVYRTLLHETTHVIQNAWPVNFNLTIDSFAEPVQMLRNVINFSARSAHGASIHYISSVAAVAKWNATGDSNRCSVPESVISDWNASAAQGYGESKLICENLLAKAADTSKIRASIYRVGQVAGPVTYHGSWTRQEWLPAIVASSKHLNCLPATLGAGNRVDWIPVDSVAEILAELVMRPGQEEGEADVFHVVNPISTTWSALVLCVAEHFASSTLPHLTSFPDWIELVRENAKAHDFDSYVHDKSPAIKLLDFFTIWCTKKDEAARYSTTKTLKHSSKLAAQGPINDQWMKIWLKQWEM